MIPPWLQRGLDRPVTQVFGNFLAPGQRVKIDFNHLPVAGYLYLMADSIVQLNSFDPTA